MASITAMNSVYALAILNLYPVPQILQGYSADAAFDTEAADAAEIVMGVDGHMSAGFVPFVTRQTISIMPDSISSLSLRTCSCRLSTAGEQAFGASEGVLARYALQSQSGSRESGALERRMARDQASAFGVVGREGWLDCGCRSQGYGSSHARLPVNPGAGHWTFDESRIAGSLRRIFGAWFGGLPGNEVAI